MEDPTIFFHLNYTNNRNINNNWKEKNLWEKKKNKTHKTHNHNTVCYLTPVWFAGIGLTQKQFNERPKHIYSGTVSLHLEGLSSSILLDFSSLSQWVSKESQECVFYMDQTWNCYKSPLLLFSCWNPVTWPYLMPGNLETIVWLCD